MRAPSAAEARRVNRNVVSDSRLAMNERRRPLVEDAGAIGKGCLSDVDGDERGRRGANEWNHSHGHDSLTG